MSQESSQREKSDGPPPPYIAALCDPRYSSRVDSERTTRLALEGRISQLFRKVWLGLYEADEGMDHCDDVVEDRTRISRLRSLAKRAGMISFSAFLDNEFDAPEFPLPHAPHHGIFSLQIFDHTSISNLECAVSILAAYEREVALLDRLFCILQEHEPGLHELRPSEATIPSEAECFALVTGMAKRLTEHDSQTEALSFAICEEAKIFSQTPHEPIGHYVYETVAHGKANTILGLGGVYFD